MSDLTLKILSGLKWWAGTFSLFFLLVLITAPSLFGIHFVSGSAIASCFVYASIGFVIGYCRGKHKKMKNIS